MERYAGLDVSFEATSVCVVDGAGRIGGIAVTIYARLDDWRSGRR